MKCAEAQRYFDEMYREGDAFGRRDVAQHVERCETCRGLYAQWRGIALELCSPPPVPSPSEGFTQRIIASIEKKRTRAVLLPFYPQRLAWAALLLISLVGLLTVQYFGTKEAQPTPEKIAALETVHFEFTAEQATAVALVGDFNEWDTKRHIMTKNSDHTWSIDLPISQGSYLYLFLVDGKEWRTDPLRGTPVPDGFGGYNSEVNL